MAKQFIYGSIDLTKIKEHRGLIKSVPMKDGSTHLFLDIAIVSRKEVGKYGHTHMVRVSPPRGQEIDDLGRYIIGDLTEYQPRETNPADIAAAPKATDEESEDLPF